MQELSFCSLMLFFHYQHFSASSAPHKSPQHFPFLILSFATLCKYSLAWCMSHDDIMPWKTAHKNQAFASSITFNSFLEHLWTRDCDVLQGLLNWPWKFSQWSICPRGTNQVKRIKTYVKADLLEFRYLKVNWRVPWKLRPRVFLWVT